MFLSRQMINGNRRMLFSILAHYAHMGVVVALEAVVAHLWHHRTVDLQSWAQIRQSPQPTVDCQSLDGLPSGMVLY